MDLFSYVRVIWQHLQSGPSPGFSSEGQKPQGGAKNQKGGATFLKYSIRCM